MEASREATREPLDRDRSCSELGVRCALRRAYNILAPRCCVPTSAHQTAGLNVWPGRRAAMTRCAGLPDEAVATSHTLHIDK